MILPTARNIHKRTPPKDSTDEASRKKRPALGARSSPRASQACQACAQAKVRCDNQRACQRCQKRGTTCIRTYPIDEGLEVDTLVTNNISAAPAESHLPINTSVNGPKVVSPDQHGHSEFIHLHDRPLQAHPDEQNTTSSSGQVNPSFLSGPSIDFLSDFSLNPNLLYPDWNFGEPRHISGIDNNNELSAFSLGDDLLSTLELLPQQSGSEILQPFPSTTTQDPSPSIHEAFQQSVGRWKPGSNNYRADQEPDLSLQETSSLLVDPATTPPAPGLELPTYKLGSQTRGNILATAIGCCSPRNLSTIVASFPSADLLEKLLNIYLRYHHIQIGTFIHLPTFNIVESRTELVIACIAAGAMRSGSRTVHNFGLALGEVLFVQLQKVSEREDILTRNLQYLQSFALQVHVGLWSGNKRRMEIAGSFVGLIVNMMRGGGRYRRSSYPRVTPTVDDHGDVLEGKWRRWIELESFKRLVFRMQIHCAQEALMTSGGSSMSYSELCLPFPEARHLWLAPTAQKWKELHLQLDTHELTRVPSLVDYLPNPAGLIYLPALYDRESASHSLLYAISSLVREYKQSELVFSAKDSVLSRQTAVVSDSQERRLTEMLRLTRAIHEVLVEDQAPFLAMVHELVEMHLHAFLDQIELVAGREGKEEAQLAWPILDQWIQSRAARQAIWHAGQVLRHMRDLSSDRLAEFHVVACYHASLCLWIYGLRAQTLSSSQVAGTADPGKPAIFLDGEETLSSQRWISYDHGIPVLSSLKSSTSNNQNSASRPNHHIPLSSTISLRATQVLMKGVVDMIRSKFPSTKPHLPLIVENICNLMQTIGKEYQA